MSLASTPPAARGEDTPQEQTPPDAQGRGRTLAIVSSAVMGREAGAAYLHLSFGRVVDELARRYERVLLCVPVLAGPRPANMDYALSEGNIEVLPQPDYGGSALGAHRRAPGVLRAYRRALSRADRVFARGLIPLAGMFYWMAKAYGLRPCHWLVGNQVRLIRSHRRGSRWMDTLALTYALHDRRAVRFGRRLTGGTLLCNGEELSADFPSPRTRTVVSTTLGRGEFHIREDTCGQPPIEILFVGFVRPEKGVEYLLEAAAKLPGDRDWKLTVVGPTDRYPGYQAKLREIVSRAGIEDRVHWEGYVSYGPAMWAYLRRADLFVLPTLSEGTPRVLVEARANSLPIISTTVGGIPTSVTDGHDGLLVPPKDVDALAGAIRRVIEDGELRRSLIRHGLETARSLTVDRFVDIIVESLEPDTGREPGSR